jgi:hypothetical protein
METRIEWRPSIGQYEVSSDGQVRRVGGAVLRNRGGLYPNVALSTNGKPKTYMIHRLVALAFLGLKHGQVVDHINGDKNDNRVANLRCVTQRENTSTFKRNNRSLPIGVSLNDSRYVNRFRARIRINGKHVDLGSYPSPECASLVYEETRFHLTKSI